METLLGKTVREDHPGTRGKPGDKVPSSKQRAGIYVKRIIPERVRCFLIPVFPVVLTVTLEA
jgi:hypothetical protein